MTTRNQNIKVNRRDTASIPVTLTQADGTPYDPTLGAVLKWRMAKTAHAIETDTLVSKEIGTGLDVEFGLVTIEIEIADTDFPADIYYHELKVIDGNDVSTAFTGNFIIIQVLGMEPVIP